MAQGACLCVIIWPESAQSFCHSPGFPWEATCCSKNSNVFFHLSALWVDCIGPVALTTELTTAGICSLHLLSSVEWTKRTTLKSGGVGTYSCPGSVFSGEERISWNSKKKHVSSKPWTLAASSLTSRASLLVLLYHGLVFYVTEHAPAVLTLSTTQIRSL